MTTRLNGQVVKNTGVSSLPLDGVIVAELGSGIAPALAGRMMAGYGAEVIKIEPPQGDPLRGVGPFPEGTASAEASAAFLYFHAGKSSVVLDLDTAIGRRALTELLASANILLTDVPDPDRALLGLARDQVHTLHPNLSVIAISPYGESGPHSHYHATDLTQFAAGGQMALMGDPDREPLKSYGNQAESQTAFHAFSAAMVSILITRRAGKGQYVELSTQEVQASSLEAQGPLAFNHQVMQGLPGRAGNGWRPVWSQYRCKDGYVGIFVNPPNLPSFFRAIGRPELLDRAADDHFMNEELRPLVEQWCAERTRHEVYAVAVETGAPFSYVATPEDLLESEVVARTGIWRVIDHPAVGQFRAPGPPFRAEGWDFELRPPPLLGEDTAEVLTTRTGLSQADVRRLVGQAALARLNGVRA